VRTGSSSRRAIAQDGRVRTEKDTKTHQQRRVSLDPETVAVLTEHWARSVKRARTLGIAPRRDAFVFSLVPDGSAHLVPFRLHSGTAGTAGS
jgi:hypothetical protein